jgi:hypothetical protein
MSDDDWRTLEPGALFAHIFETMQALMGTSEEFAPAAPFREVQEMIDELIRRCPEMEFGELAEFRDVLRTALAGHAGPCGHA